MPGLCHVPRPSRPGGRRIAAAILIPIVAGAVGLAGCSSGTTASGSSASTSASASPSSSAEPLASASAAPTVAAVTAPVRKTSIGISVTGDLGQKPALTVPASSPPSGLKVEELVAGTGAKVAKGQSLVANYLGQTWTPKDGKVNIFDNSYDRRSPAAFQIGTGKVIPGWDQALVGRPIGSRLLLSIPAALAYGTASSADNELAGQHLLFVVDILGAVDGDASAEGAAAAAPAGFPTVSSSSGKEPKITSVKGLVPSATSRSALLVKGSGAAIDPAKFLALQFVQTDAATGTQTQGTWGRGIELVPAGEVLAVASALKGQRVGSRVVAVTGKSASAASLVVVVDVVGQF